MTPPGQHAELTAIRENHIIFPRASLRPYPSRFSGQSGKMGTTLHRIRCGWNECQREPGEECRCHAPCHRHINKAACWNANTAFAPTSRKPLASSAISAFGHVDFPGGHRLRISPQFADPRNSSSTSPAPLFVLIPGKYQSALTMQSF